MSIRLLRNITYWTATKFSSIYLRIITTKFSPYWSIVVKTIATARGHKQRIAAIDFLTKDFVYSYGCTQWARIVNESRKDMRWNRRPSCEPRAASKAEVSRFTCIYQSIYYLCLSNYNNPIRSAVHLQSTFHIWSAPYSCSVMRSRSSRFLSTNLPMYVYKMSGIKKNPTIPSR